MTLTHASSEKPETVLVVEDDDVTRELVCGELELEQYTVHGVTNGQEAIDAARALKPDVILMDIMMPVLNGIDATRILKSNKDTKQIPVLMVTALDGEEEIINSLNAGASDYITKPLSLPELKARVKAALTSREIHEEWSEIKEQLIMARKKCHSLLGQASAAIVVVQDGKTTFFNSRFLEITGCSSEELGTKLFLDNVFPEDREKTNEHYVRTVDNGDSSTFYTLRIVTNKGFVKPLEASSVLIQWEDKPACLIALTGIADCQGEGEQKERIQLAPVPHMEALCTLASGMANDFNDLFQVLQGYAGLLPHLNAEDRSDSEELQEIETAIGEVRNLSHRLRILTRSAECKLLPPSLSH
ncbi:MAG: response regulator [Deltaproteobacteria bacterium]|nr:MAG: response regulator [Deltaproteobacteria bacterium]